MILSQKIQEVIRASSLPASFGMVVETFYRPLARQVKKRTDTQKDGPLVFALQGTQGSGKSTCALFLKLLLEDLGLACAILSIDDFYLELPDRIRLASEVHPLLRTRGVPGTHDVALAMTVFQNLLKGKAGQKVALPRFDKSTDNRLPRAQWPEVVLPVDVILFEGWCVGMRPQQPDELLTPVNELERCEDPQGCWRGYVNEQLDGPYRTWFELIDCLAVLQAPSFECVYGWRQLQEEKLKARLGAKTVAALKNPPPPQAGALKIMNEEELRRFISHYERLTRHGLKTLPDLADWLFWLKEDHTISSFEVKRKAG